VLLIVRALGAGDLGRLHREAREAGLDVLVEIHDDAELEPALAAGATIVGVNSRDLQTLSVDPAVVRRLAGRIPPGVAAVAESGIRAARDVAELRRAGYSAFLIGEHLMTSADPGETLRALLGEAASA
jgi:indole-3-glycerol phosphate synthase